MNCPWLVNLPFICWVLAPNDKLDLKFKETITCTFLEMGSLLCLLNSNVILFSLESFCLISLEIITYFSWRKNTKKKGKVRRFKGKIVCFEDVFLFFLFTNLFIQELIIEHFLCAQGLAKCPVNL